METEECKTMSDFMKALEGTPLMEVFRIMEDGIFYDAGLPEVKEGAVFVCEMSSAQKAAQTLLSKLEKEYAELDSTTFNTVIPKINSADFEIFVQKLERLEKLQDDMSYVWDFLWKDIEKCTKKSRDDLILSIGFKIELRINAGQTNNSLENRFKKVMSSLGFMLFPADNTATSQKEKEKMN